MKIGDWRLKTGVAALLLAFGCSKPTVEEVQTTAAAPVKTITLAPAMLEGIVAASGVVSAAPGADWVITAPEPARIVELPKAEGDHVNPGDLLVRLLIVLPKKDDPELQAFVKTWTGRKTDVQR